MLRVKSPQDFGAAMVFLLIGLGGIWFGREYEVGTTKNMGPGFFPLILSVGLVLFGLFFTVRSVRFEGPPIEASRLRPTLLILAAITSFGFLIERAGLAPATAVVIAVSAYATSDAKWKETAALALFMAAFCVVVFIYGLRQAMSIWTL